MSDVVTRFAPSPTGHLHIGGARTAIFCWLLARHYGGRFHLRIEDTDLLRSKQEYTDSILASMRWLGLDWDGGLTYQTRRTDLYNSYVDKLLETGHAYWCSCTPEEVEAMREEARQNGLKPRYNGHCRTRDLGPGEGRCVRLKTPLTGKVVFDELGEMLFTHFGVSGPIVLSASAHMRRFGEARYRLEIDLKPALDEQTLDKRLVSDFARHANSDLINAFDELLPKKLIVPFVELTGLDPRQKVHDVTKEQRRRILGLLKALPVEIAGPRPVEEAIVTSGGVSVKEVNPSTMESKRLPGLYFAGEVLDVDGYTGGFNLQIAWSTGHLAGISAARACW